MCVCVGGDCIGFLKALVGINLLQKHRFEIIIVSPAFGRWLQGAGRKAHSKEATGGDMRSAVKFWVALPLNIIAGCVFVSLFSWYMSHFYS